MNNIPPQMKAQAAGLAEMNGVILGGTLSKDLALEAILTFATKDAAGKAKTELDGFVTLGKLFVKDPKAPPAAGKFIDSLKVSQDGAEVKVTANLELDMKAFGPMMGPFGPGFGPGVGPGPKKGKGPAGFGEGPVGGPVQRITSINNLKQIALAMHNFHDANQKLPGYAIFNPQTGAPLLSWRVAILPYIEEGALFQQIRMNERWDSQHNRQFWNRMPRTYLVPGKPNDGKTYYQVFRGNDTVFPPDAKTQMRFTMITDGTSNTLMVVEAADPVNWMAPDDIVFQKGQPGLNNRLGNHWGDNTFCAAFCDGVARPLRRNMASMTLDALITRNGGEVLPPDGEWQVP